MGSIPRSGRSPGRGNSNSLQRQWEPTPVLLPGKSHGRRSQVGCHGPWGRGESDTTERLHFLSLSQYSYPKIPETGKPGGLQSMGLQRVGPDGVTENTRTSAEGPATKPSMGSGKAVHFSSSWLKAFHNLVLQSLSLTGHRDSVPVDTEPENRSDAHSGPAGPEITEGGQKTWACPIPPDSITRQKKERVKGWRKTGNAFQLSFLSGVWNRNIFLSVEIWWVWMIFPSMERTLRVSQLECESNPATYQQFCHMQIIFTLGLGFLLWKMRTIIFSS